jgi:catechol 2,3-dioxygenase-like lactoylglutathione lyase family enzyme
MTTAPTSPVRFDVVALDTDDPPGLAAFYTALLGWQFERADPDWITISGSAGARIAFRLAPGHRPPTWPDPASSMQFHLHFRVDDLDAGEALVLGMGGTKLDEQPGNRVYTDPAGHPFCLCRQP